MGHGLICTEASNEDVIKVIERKIKSPKNNINALLERLLRVA